MRILLATDQLARRRRTLAALCRFVARGNITCATTGAEVVARAHAGSFSLIILEPTLPDFSADRVIELLRGPLIPPVLVLASRKNGARVPKALPAGAWDWLPVELISNAGRLKARLQSVVVEAEGDAEMVQRHRAQHAGALASGLAGDLLKVLDDVESQITGIQRALLERPGQPADWVEVGDAARHATALAEQITGFVGATESPVAAIDLNQHVGRVLNRVGNLRRERVVLQRNLSPQLWKVAGHAQQIRMMFEALLANALEAVASSGTVTVMTENALAAASAAGRPTDDCGAGEFVHLCVADTGAGIDSRNRLRMFDPQFSTKGTGRGFGLAAVASIVSGMGGFIRVETALHCGTEMHVYLPRSESTERHPARSARRSRA